MRSHAESGYALVMALWILLLAAALAGILMMRAVSASRDVAGERRLLLKQVAEESALQDAAAQLLFAQPPGPSGVVEANGITPQINIGYSREGERADANDASLEVITDALLAAGLDRATTGRIMAMVQERRAGNVRWSSLAELISGVLSEHAACVAEALTVHGGRTNAVTSPDGGAAVSLVATRQSAIRLRVEGDGQQRTVIVRPALSGASPIATLEILYLGRCATQR